MRAMLAIEWVVTCRPAPRTDPDVQNYRIGLMARVVTQSAPQNKDMHSRPRDMEVVKASVSTGE